MIFLLSGLVIVIGIFAVHISTGRVKRGYYWDTWRVRFWWIGTAGSVCLGLIISFFVALAWQGTYDVNYEVESVQRTINNNYEEYVIDTKDSTGAFSIWREDLNIVEGPEEKFTVAYKSDCPLIWCIFDVVVASPYDITGYTLTTPDAPRYASSNYYTRRHLAT